MTHDAPILNSALQGEQASGPQVRRAFCWLLGVLALGLLVQLPRVMDFEKFGFYDEGAWLHLDALFGAGAVPGKDVGYSYGMLPLIVGHGWFLVAGHSPWAFLVFMTACNVWPAWWHRR